MARSRLVVLGLVPEVREEPSRRERNGVPFGQWLDATADKFAERLRKRREKNIRYLAKNRQKIREYNRLYKQQKRAAMKAERDL